MIRNVADGPAIAAGTLLAVAALVGATALGVYPPTVGPVSGSITRALLAGLVGGVAVGMVVGPNPKRAAASAGLSAVVLAAAGGFVLTFGDRFDVHWSIGVVVAVSVVPIGLGVVVGAALTAALLETNERAPDR